MYVTFALQLPYLSSPVRMGLEECSSAVCKFEIEQPVSASRWLLNPFWVLFWVVSVFLPNQRTDAEFG